MSITLDQAIDIHAEVLVYKFGKHAKATALQYAVSSSRKKDDEGRDVWTRVATAAERIFAGRSRDRTDPKLH